MIPFLAVLMQARKQAVVEMEAANAEAKAQGWVSQTSRQVQAATALAEIDACIPASVK